LISDGEDSDCDSDFTDLCMVEDLVDFGDESEDDDECNDTLLIPDAPAVSENASEPTYCLHRCY
jgi:hypothetical protein